MELPHQSQSNTSFHTKTGNYLTYRHSTVHQTISIYKECICICPSIHSIRPSIVWIMSASNSILTQHCMMLRTSGAGRNICASHCSGFTSSACFFRQYQIAAL